MKPPCEIIVNRIIPNVRAILAKDLSERHEMCQAEIAEKLGITQPAVSQYLHSGKDMEKIESILKEAEIYQEIRELSDKMANGEPERIEITKKYCNICQSLGRDEIDCILQSGDTHQLTEEEFQIYQIFK